MNKDKEIILDRLLQTNEIIVTGKEVALFNGNNLIIVIKLIGNFPYLSEWIVKSDDYIINPSVIYDILEEYHFCI